jgi:hypothetical protein
MLHAHQFSVPPRHLHNQSGPVSREVSWHNYTRSSCFQVRMATCCGFPGISSNNLRNIPDSSEMISYLPECLELQPVISQTQLVHLYLAAGSPRSLDLSLWIWGIFHRFLKYDG